MRSNFIHCSILFCVGIFSCASNTNAETLIINEDIAKQKPIEISIVNGQASSIALDNGQKINFVLLPDQSQSIYTADSPIDEGKATTIYLRKIEKLEIPGATTTNKPNLQIHAVDDDGKIHRYEFYLNISTGVERDRIVIKQAELPPSPPKKKVINTIKTTYGVASPEDIRLGLEFSINSGKIKNDGLLARSVKEYIALTLNGVSIFDALSQTKLNIAVIEKLATIGQEQETKRRIITPSNATPANSFPVNKI